MVIGTIIGASIFVQPSLVSGAVPSVPGMLLVWGVAGVLTRHLQRVPPEE